MCQEENRSQQRLCPKVPIQCPRGVIGESADKVNGIITILVLKDIH